MSNYLLLKDDIGRPRPPTRELPIGKHSYGLPIYRDKEGAAACNNDVTIDKL